MAGHSKWANIKYRKEKQDQKRGAIFSKLAKEITLAARAGADPEKNAALANALARARAFNLPKENIERAIKRATGELPGVRYEEIIYEGYGPGGVALLLRVVTDNRNRAAAEIRRIFEDFDGSLGESGSVAWQFSRKGLVVINKEAAGGRDLEDLLIEIIDLGAEDIQEKDGEIEVYCRPEALSAVKEGVERLGLPVARAEVSMIPQSTVHLEGKEAERLLRFLERLDEQEDVQEVYANFDIPDEILEKVA